MASRAIRFNMVVTVGPEFWAALAPYAKQRACRTCDYGDSPDCGHESRAERVCAAPVGDFDCAVVPCLGSCANPAGGAR